jgi:hypothetical protein
MKVWEKKLSKKYGKYYLYNRKTGESIWPSKLRGGVGDELGETNKSDATLEYTTETTIPPSSIKSVREIPNLRDVFRHQITGLRYNEKKPDILMPPSREPALNFKVNPIEQEKVERKLIEDAKKIEEERNVMLGKRVVRKRIAEECKRMADLDAQKIKLLQDQIKLLQEQLKVAQEEIKGNKKVREQELNMILAQYRQDINFVMREAQDTCYATRRSVGYGDENYQTVNLLIEDLLRPLAKGTKRIVSIKKQCDVARPGEHEFRISTAAKGTDFKIITLT